MTTTATTTKTRKGTPRKTTTPKVEATPKVQLVYTRNGESLTRNSLSYYAYLEGEGVDTFRRQLVRKGAPKNFDGPFDVTLKSGTRVTAVLPKVTRTTKK